MLEDDLVETHLFAMDGGRMGVRGLVEPLPSAAESVAQDADYRAGAAEDRESDQLRLRAGKDGAPWRDEQVAPQDRPQHGGQERRAEVAEQCDRDDRDKVGRKRQAARHQRFQRHSKRGRAADGKQRDEVHSTSGDRRAANIEGLWPRMGQSAPESERRPPPHQTARLRSLASVRDHASGCAAM